MAMPLKGKVVTSILIVFVGASLFFCLMPTVSGQSLTINMPTLGVQPNNTLNKLTTINLVYVLLPMLIISSSILSYIMYLIGWRRKIIIFASFIVIMMIFVIIAVGFGLQSHYQGNSYGLQIGPGGTTSIAKAGSFYLMNTWTCSNQPDQNGVCNHQTVFHAGDHVYSYIQFSTTTGNCVGFIGTKDSYNSYYVNFTGSSFSWYDSYGWCYFYIWDMPSCKATSADFDIHNLEDNKDTYVSNSVTVLPNCGDGVCDYSCGETSSSCPSDCPSEPAKIITMNYYQQVCYWCCGDAAMQMVLNHYGVNIAQNQIAADTNGWNGLYLYQVQQYLQSKLPNKTVSTRYGMTISDIQNNLNNGNPMIIEVNWLPGNSSFTHFVVPIGYDSGHILTYDPDYGDRLWSNSALMSNWASNGGVVVYSGVSGDISLAFNGFFSWIQSHWYAMWHSPSK